MTKDGIIKLASINKQANTFYSTITDLSSVALVALALAAGGSGFLSGVLYSRATAPRKTDIQNSAKQYQVARLQSDLAKQKALLNRETQIYDDKAQPKKSVYGIV